MPLPSPPDGAKDTSFPLPAWLLCLVGLGAALVAFPRLDLAAASLFYSPGAPLNFMMRANVTAMDFQAALHAGSLALGVLLAVGFLAALRLRHGPSWLRPRPLLFLLLALVLGPGLLTNTLFKDNWGRARPMTVTEFDGPLHFTPAFVVSDQCDANCSFFSGDAAAMFYLHSFAYVAPVRRRRKVLAATLLAGAAVGVMRMSQGGHFLSDIVFAALFMMLATAFSHALVFGRIATVGTLRGLLGGAPDGGP